MSKEDCKLDEVLKRLKAVEKELAEVKSRTPEVDEETLMAISAAVAAYLGVKAKVRAIRYQTESGQWAAVGRRAVQSHEVK